MENENKDAMDFPKVSFEKIKDKSFMNQFEKYFSEQFIFRDDLINFKTNVEVSLGKKEINGVHILKDKFIEKVDIINEDYVKNSLDAINLFQKEKKIPTSVVIIPTAQEIYKESIFAKPTLINQSLITEKFYEYLNNDISKIDVYTNLNIYKDKYIYYRTDHHLTSLGSGVVYNSIGKSLGFNPISLDKFEIEHSNYDFKGSLYSKVLYNKIVPDFVDIYYNNSGIEVENVEIIDGEDISNSNSIIFRDKLESKNKYDVFLGGNYPVVNITTTNKNGKNLLLFKDSYANSLIQFLYHHYEKITLVDLRYLNVSFEKFVDVNSYNQVLFLYNFSNFISENNIRKIRINK